MEDERERRPDRRRARVLRPRGARIRFEVKALDGKLSKDQLKILTAEYCTGGIAACGGLEELRHLLVSLRHSQDEASRLGWLFVQLWAARGLRGTRKGR